MSKEINDRYESCRELRDDLKAWLNDQPVSARRPSLVRQAGRFIRQHPWPTGLTCVSLTLLGVLAFTMSSAYSRADRDRTEIDRQRLSAEAETRRAEELIVQLRGANGEIEKARNDAVAAMKRAESALADVQRQTALTLEAENDRKKAVQQATAAEEAAVMASQQVKDTEYKKRIQDAADLIASGRPSSARKLLPGLQNDQSQIELRHLWGCIEPVIAEFNFPSDKASSQVCIDMNCRTLVLRETDGTINIGRRTTSDWPASLEWSKISGLPHTVMSLTPAGKSLFYCREARLQNPIPGTANAYRVSSMLEVADYAIAKEIIGDDPEPLIWRPTSPLTIFPSGVSAAIDASGRLIVSDAQAGMRYDLSRSCSRRDWNTLTQTKVDHLEHQVRFKRRFGTLKSEFLEIRKDIEATFATSLPDSNAFLIGYSNGAVEVVGPSKKESSSFGSLPERNEEVLGVTFFPEGKYAVVHTLSGIRQVDLSKSAVVAQYHVGDGQTISSLALTPTGNAVVAHVLERKVSGQSRILLFNTTAMDGKSLGMPFTGKTSQPATVHAALSGDCEHAVLATPKELQIIRVSNGETMTSIPSTEGMIIAAYFLNQDEILSISKTSANRINWKNGTVVENYDLIEPLGERDRVEILSVIWLPQTQEIGITYGRPYSVGIISEQRSQVSFAFLQLNKTGSQRAWNLGVAGQDSRPNWVLTCNERRDMFVIQPSDEHRIEVRRNVEAPDGKILYGADDSVTSAAITPDSTRVLTGHNDGIIKFWDAATGEELLSTYPTRSPVKSISISADSRKAIVTYADGAVQLIGDVYLSDAGPSAGKL